MKKMLLTLGALAAMYIAHAQTPTPYYTGFDNAAEQAGWQGFRKGATTPFGAWGIGAGFGNPTPPNLVGHDYPVGGSPTPVIDWFVSPWFDFSGGGKIDNIKVRVYAITGSADPTDHFGIYLLTGSPDPSAATSVTLLADLTQMANSTFAFEDTSNFVIPPTAGKSYIGFKYTSTGNWFTPYFDNLDISANAPCAAPSSISVTPSITSANITWTAQPGASGYEYVLDNSAASPAGSGTPTALLSYSPTGLTPSTTYYMHVRTQCSPTLTSAWNTQSFTTQAPPPPCPAPAAINLTNVTATDVTLGWANVGGTKGYEVTVNETAADPTVSGSTSMVNFATVASLKPATRYYAHLRSRCDSSGRFNFSQWVTKEFFTHFPSGIYDAVSDKAISVYPNPVLHTMRVVAPVNSDLSVTDMSGHVLHTVKTSAEITEIDMNSYPAGVYILQCTSGDIRTHTKVNKL